MNELIIKGPHGGIRWQLLTTASALALTFYISSANAADVGHPTVWIEAGWHFESMTGSVDPVAPPLNGLALADGFTSTTDYQNLLGKTYGAEGGISFQPKGSEWIFSIAARYGRVNSHRHLHQEAAIPERTSHDTIYNVPFTRIATQQPDYQDAQFDNGETHTILDFQVGRDVGLGLFGRHSSAVANFGVRYAQFTAASAVHGYAKANGHFTSVPHTKYGALKGTALDAVYHSSISVLEREGNFHGIGPSLSWESATPLLGDTEAGELTLDWGANAAVLFGRQKQKVERQSTGYYYYWRPTAPVAGHPGMFKKVQAHTITTGGNSDARSRSVTVPNVGGFAGISYRFTNAKFSAGYRADFFFGAMDGGVDTHRSITTGFHGPFATFSIGLGD